MCGPNFYESDVNKIFNQISRKAKLLYNANKNLRITWNNDNLIQSQYLTFMIDLFSTKYPKKKPKLFISFQTLVA